MSELNIYGAVNGDTETGYPKGDTNGSLSDASTIPQDDCASVEVFAGGDLHYQTMNPKVTQAIRVVKKYCAMGRGAKNQSGGRTPGFGTYSRGANDCTKCWRGGYKKCSDSIGCK
jgi:hypothetical protein